MIVGTYLNNKTSVTIDIDKTPIERIQMIFEDAGVQVVLVINKDEDTVRYLDNTFAIYAWSEIIEKGKTFKDNQFCPPSSESEPFAIYYTR